MKIFSLFLLFIAQTSNAFIMQGSQINAVTIEPDAVVLGADTSGSYVEAISEGDGISSTGAATGEAISHVLSIDQSFEPTWTGIQTFTPADTKDVIINTDADSHLRIVGTSSAVGTFLCLDGSDNLVDCDTANTIALTTDTTGNYVGTVTAGTGISTTGAATGEGIAHSISVDQTFNPVWTGQHTYSGSGAYTSESHFLDHAGNPATRKSTIVYTATGMEPGELSAVNFTLIDTADSTGGQISNINCQMIPTGAADVACMFAGAGVFPVVAAFGSPPAAPSQAWRETSGPTFTDSTTAFGSAGTDVQIFVADNDRIYVGEDTSFFEIRVILAVASSSNVAPIFEYWNGSAWTTFVPNDGTAGFTRDGNINFNKDTLLSAGWVANSVNGVSKFYIRITRTENTVPTPPTEDTIILTDGVQNQWDPDGKITAQNIATLGTGTNTLSGKLQLTGTVTVHATCNAGNVGLFEMFDNGANKTSLCVCERTGAATYAFGAVTAGGAC